MKTRIIQTRFWDDEFVSSTDIYTQHLYIYLLTSQYINISGMFQLPTKKILLESNLTENQFNTAKNNLETANKVKFKDGWICVLNACKNNKYTNSPDNQKAYDREVSQVPDKIRAYFDSSVESSVESSGGVVSTLPINKNSELINKKREDFKKFIVTLKESEEFAGIDIDRELLKFKDYLLSHGKKPKDSKAAFRNWLRNVDDFKPYQRKEQPKGDNQRMLEKLNATRS